MVLLVSYNKLLITYLLDSYIFGWMLWSSSNKIFSSVLWYAYSISRDKLFIIPKNLAGSYSEILERYIAKFSLICTMHGMLILYLQLYNMMQNWLLRVLSDVLYIILAAKILQTHYGISNFVVRTNCSLYS